MFDLIVLALIQIATLTGTPTNNIGSTGWDHDYTGTPTNNIGSTGWDHDYTGTPAPTTPADPSIGSTGWDHD
jgi:hypothetical protein